MKPSVWRRAGMALVFGLTLAPIWAEPRLATQDGSSHVYNAALTTWIRAGREPFGSSFAVATGLRPNSATHDLLAATGARVGWSAAERLLVTAAVTAAFAAVMAVAPPATAALPVAGWLASSWFVWMGFYDFALSIPCFLGLVLALRRPASRSRTIAIQLLFACLYYTHLFTFATGVAMTASALAWEARGRRASWRGLWMVAPAAIVLALELFGGGPTAGAIVWTETPWERIAAAASGDFVVTLLGPDSLAGVLLFAATIATIVVRVRLRPAERPAWFGVELFGIALIALSLAAPDSMGEGGYIPARMRFLGTLAMLTAIMDVARRLPRMPARAAGALLFVALAGRTAWLMRDADLVRGESAAVHRLLLQAGAVDGSWVVSRLTAYRRWPFRVGVYRHLTESVATSPALVVLNNYEALNGIFFVRWRRRPDWVSFRPLGDTLVARLIPGDVTWPGAIYVVHEPARPVATFDPRLEVGRTTANGSFAVTVVRKRD